jgi:hypothetical protein
MSFDMEPEIRHLLYHPESESLFEVFHEGQFEEALANLCEDVTGMDKFEERFKKAVPA